jgi:eukaryotic-like serine/threonine-protein kinase
MDSASSHCSLGGTPSSDCRGLNVCSYCLLRLGLDPAGAAPALEGGTALRNDHGIMDLPDYFIRQGVLPQFGDYELLSEIARGGMGVVYRARQRGLDRIVAVKLILAGQLATRESVQRFRHEAQAAAQLHHPGIVPIYEIGEYETQHFFSMKLIDGVSLAECLNEFVLRTGVSPRERSQQQQCIAELLAKVARALDFAHQHGVLHRDLKPSNILIDLDGQPYLTDFGLAKLTGREASGLTLSHAVLGTPGYLAPEQAAGSEKITSAVDVYGLGATLYELLTGRPPFVGANAVETMRMAIDQHPVAPHRVNPLVPRDLETIAMRCLEKQPEHRYRSAAAVADDLERFLHGTPIHSRPVSAGEQFWRWCRRKPALAGLAAALSLALLIGGAVSTWQWRRAERANVVLAENLAHLQWNVIDDLLQAGQSSQALAQVASLLRQTPDDWQGAMFSVSLLEQRRFPIPAAPPIRHSGGAELTVARLSPDGSRIATASVDGTARIWDAATSQPLVPPLEHQAPVTWAEFRPDSKVLATCSLDNTVRLWNANTGEPMGEPHRQAEAASRIQFSSNGWYLLVQSPTAVSILSGINGWTLAGPIRCEGRVLAARFQDSNLTFTTVHEAGYASRMRTWLLPLALEVTSLQTGPLRDADVNDDLTRVVVADAEGRAWVADYPSGENRSEIVSRNGEIQRVAFSPGGDDIAALGANHWARVFDAKTAMPTTSELPHFHSLAGMAFLPMTQLLLTWSNDSLAQVWDLPKDSLYCEPLRSAGRVLYAEFRRQAERDVFLTTDLLRTANETGSGSGTAQLWTCPRHGSPRDRAFGIGVYELANSAISADGELIALANPDGEVGVRDRLTGELVSGPFQVNELSEAPALLFSQDASRLLVMTSQGELSVWSIPEGQRLFEPVRLPPSQQPAVTTVDGKYLATQAEEGVVTAWDSATGHSLGTLRHGSDLNAVAFSPDGKHIATAGTDRAVRLWKTASGKLVNTLTGHQNEVMGVIFSPDGRKLVTASLDFTLRIWNTADGRERSILTHHGEILDACFSPDGRFVASASRDRTAMIWEVETGRPHTRSLLHSQSVINIRFSPDSQQLLTLDYRGLRLWDVETGRPLTVRIPVQFETGTGFQSDNGRPAFTPDGVAVCVEGDNYVSKILYLPTPTPSVPSWFAGFLEAVAGQRFEPGSEMPTPVPPENILKLRRQLESSVETDFYTSWARQWLGLPGRD